MSVTIAEIMAWVGTFAWPWIRISALLLSAPLFSNVQVPVQIHILLGLTLTVAVLPAVGDVPAVDPLSMAALLIAVQQVLIGLTMGVLVATALQTVVVAGESIAMTMGLGFAQMMDPQSGVSVPVMSQFLLVVTMLLFMAVGGHLLLIELLADSFRLMPVAADGLVSADFLAVAVFGGQMFAGAVLIALPAILVLLITNLAMGIMTRAAPQMNIFSVGFPITMLLGFLVVLTLVLPALQARLADIWSAAFGAARHLLGA
jgi:flagellar biosynthetic protein FliR